MTTMTYFAELARRLNALPTTERGTWIDAVGSIERQAIHEVIKLLADEEFPPAIRDKIEAHIRECSVYAQQAKAWKSRKSLLIPQLAAAFTELAHMRHSTRFGVLSACPIDNAFRRAAHERRPQAVAMPALGSPATPAATQLAELRERLKHHDDKSSPLYDEDHARNLRAQVQRLEQGNGSRE